MQTGTRNTFELSYCSNVHAGESWQAVFAKLVDYILPLKARLAPNQAFGIGLRLSNQAASELLAGAQLAEFKRWLAEHQLYILTVNGFVYGHFHGQPVKADVYAPDWKTSERKEYSLKLLKIIAELTPIGGECGFSSAPLSYKLWPDSAGVWTIASQQLAALVIEMVGIHQRDNKLLHIDLEPEPDCLLTSITDVIEFFHTYLLPIGIPQVAQALGISSAKARSHLLKHVRLCYDVCHLAVEFEDPATIFKRLAAAEILIGKLQISTALKVLIPKQTEVREQLQQQLQCFADSTYLHQVVARYADGKLQRYPDLAPALSDLPSTAAEEWRVHFHLPIFIERAGLFHTTQADLKTALTWLQQNCATRCLEIETYTWDVLPAELKLPLLDSLEREYRWVIAQL
jgi:sugar phosphate isomerase/epimerase